MRKGQNQKTFPVHLLKLCKENSGTALRAGLRLKSFSKLVKPLLKNGECSWLVPMISVQKTNLHYLSWRSQQLENISFQSQQNSAVDAGVKTMKSSFWVSSALGSWKAPPVPHPSATLAAHWDEQGVHTRGEGWEGCTGHCCPPWWAHSGCQLTQVSCSGHTRRVSLSNNKDLPRENQQAKKPLCLLLRMKMTPEFAKPLIFK